jgi:hypothetical protein
MKRPLLVAAVGSVLGFFAWSILWCVVWQKRLVGEPTSTAIISPEPYWVDFAAGALCLGIPTGALLGFLGGWILLRIRERAESQRTLQQYRASRPNPFGGAASSESNEL